MVSGYGDGKPAPQWRIFIGANAERPALVAQIRHQTVNKS